MNQNAFKMFLLTVVMFRGPEFATGKTVADVDRLVQDLKSNYSIYARPPRNQSQVLTVNMSYLLNAIKEFDEVNGKFSVTGSVVIAWEDDRLQWRPEEYGGLDHILVDNDVFWTPPLYLQNSVDETEKIGEKPYWKVRFQSPGVAIFYPGASFSAVCTAKVFNFPWDEQICYLAFTLIGYLQDEITLKPFSTEYVDPLQYFYGNGLWEIERSSAITVDSTIVFGFFMKRKPLLALVNIILPIVLMSFLNIMVFLIPAESGERISFCLTVLLAIAVFLTLVSDSMPKSATSISFLSYYLVAVLSLSILITIGTILNLKIYFKDDDTDVPQWLQKVARCLSCRRRQGRTDVKTKSKYQKGMDKNSDRHFAYISDNYLGILDQSKGRQDASLSKCEINLSLGSCHQEDTRTSSGAFIVPRYKAQLDINGRQNDYTNVGEVTTQNRASSENSGNGRKSEDCLTWKNVNFAVDMVLLTTCCVILIAITLTFFIIATTVTVTDADKI